MISARMHCSLLMDIYFVDDSDFVAFNPLWVVNTTAVHLLTYDDNITLEYDDSVILTFTPNDPDLISSLEAAGEYIRDTATVNIRDNDSKSHYRDCRTVCILLTGRFYGPDSAPTLLYTTSTNSPNR